MDRLTYSGPSAVRKEWRNTRFSWDWQSTNPKPLMVMISARGFSADGAIGSRRESWRGTAVYLTNGVKSEFAMTEFNPHRNWKWLGAFLWLTVCYDHVLELLDARRTKLIW